MQERATFKELIGFYRLSILFKIGFFLERHKLYFFSDLVHARIKKLYAQWESQIEKTA